MVTVNLALLNVSNILNVQWDEIRTSFYFNLRCNNNSAWCLSLQRYLLLHLVLFKFESQLTPYSVVRMDRQGNFRQALLTITATDWFVFRGIGLRRT